jgi:hypothetical protein
MTGKADFTAEEWATVAHGPSTAGLIVITAQRGGVLRETLALTQAYVEARNQHGQSELLDEIVSARPALDHSRYHSAEELKEAGLKNVRATVELLEQKAAPEEIEAYKRFVLNLAERVANAHREHGTSVSDAEQAALDQIAAALETPSG